MATFRIVGKAIVLSLVLFCSAEGGPPPGGGGGGGLLPIIGGGGGANPIVGGGDGPIIDVVQFGATPGGKKDGNMAFIRDFKKACETPDARLVIPEGEFLVGPVVFQGPCKWPITVELAAVLKAPTNSSLYEEDFWFSFENIDGLMFTGKGTLDGQGAESWAYNDCKQNTGCQMLPAVRLISLQTDLVE